MRSTGKVRYDDVRVSLEGNALDVSGGIVNLTGEDWSEAEGWAVGYHLFDDPTGTLVVDGKRIPLNLPASGEDPGMTARKVGKRFDMQIATPPEPGEYSIYVSAMREHVAWFYQAGWPFLLVDVAVGEDGQAQLRRWRITDLRGVRMKRFRRSLGRAFTLPFQSIWRNRSLIRTLVRRDVMSRYTGSFGGAFWAILNPLLLMLTYFFVFGIVMKTRVGTDESRTGYALYFLAGMLPWLAFSEAAGRAPFVMLEHRNFIRKLVFPVETLPVNSVVSGLVTEFFGLLLFLLALLILRGRVPVTVLYLPLVIVPQILFTTGIAWFLAALAVFMRDLGQVIGYLLTILMFLTPIFYLETGLPHFAERFIHWNPLFVLVHSYRAALLDSRAPEWTSLGWFALASFFLFLIGHAWFYKLQKSFADLI